MTLLKTSPKLLLLCLGLNITLTGNHASANEYSESLWGFKGGYLVSISDSDMVASAYTDGKLGPREGEDRLSIIDLSGKPGDYRAIEVPASNSVGVPPAVLSVDSAGQFAYIIETFKPRPSDSRPHTFSDLKAGNLMTVYSLQDKQNPHLIAKHSIASRPDSVDISPDGKWLLITYQPGLHGTQKPLGIYRMEGGHIKAQHFPSLPNWREGDRLIYASWSPDGNTVALINNSKAEVSFLRFDADTAKVNQWGNTVSVGKAPLLGNFSEDGQHFLVNNLFWGPDVQGKWNEAPNGTIANIHINIEGNSNQPRHSLTSQVMTGPSPEGFAISPSGEFVAAINMERSWLPYNDPRQSWFSSITLIKRDPKTGAMNTLHTTAYDGILPESAVFDNSGQYLAVTTFDHYDHAIPGGSIDFFRVVSDPLNAERKMVMKTRWSVPVARGPHTLQLIQ